MGRHGGVRPFVMVYVRIGSCRHDCTFLVLPNCYTVVYYLDLYYVYWMIHSCVPVRRMQMVGRVAVVLGRLRSLGLVCSDYECD